ncbi:MAG: helix-turn-helix transcriptional regulator [Bacteroidetes bacterium]|nr:helix-turn-helix transcriptional regulator [Bacteroidota bacterium]
MVCHRCILMVEQILEKLNLPYKQVTLGEAILENNLQLAQKKLLEQSLQELGFERIDDKISRTIEKLKTAIIQWVREEEKANPINLSDYLIEQLHQDYSTLSHLFSEVEGITIEKYAIAQKIERVKELLVYDELSLKEIAHQLNYSSTAYLSNQFKKITGLSPSHFKKIKNNKRIPLDKI